MAGEVDFGRAARDYATWNATFPEVAFDRLVSLGVIRDGARVLDLGCGAGLASRAIALRGGIVTAIDPSPELIAEAMTRDGGLPIEYRIGPAEALPVTEGRMDAAVAVRAWHWFDRAHVLAELRRVLVNRGWLAVMDSVFLPKRSDVARRTAELIREARQGSSLAAGSKAGVIEMRNGFPSLWFNEWREAGFELEDEWTLPYTVEFSHEGWRGRVRALSSVVELSEALRGEMDTALAALLRAEFPSESLVIPHECYCVLWRRKDHLNAHQ